MRKILLIVCIFPLFVFPQTQSGQSRTEQLLLTTGVTLKKEFINVGKLSSYNTLPVTIEVVKVTDLKTLKTFSGVRISDAFASAILDKEEIDGLIAGLEKMKDAFVQSGTDNYTEYVFTSNSGFKIILSTDEKKSWAFNIDFNKVLPKGNFLTFEKGQEFINNFSEIIAKAQPQL